MREIKFRAWDKTSKNMMYQHDGWSEDTDVLKEVFLYLRRDYRYVIMQYTGLADKNDKEIWEGDIGISKTVGGTFDKLQVVFHDGCFYVDWIDESLRGYLYRQEDNFEVIGNIFETQY